ncbi:hypothetical protein P7C70_g3843, partial [Phenoliferia sp. Uapishka_3]
MSLLSIPLSKTSIAAAFSVSLIVCILHRLFIRPLLSPLRDIPGPPSASIVYGNLQRIIAEQPGTAHREWSEKYGKGGVVRYRGFFGEDRIFFTDPAALSHILVTHSYDYPKPQEVRGNLSRILGKGILFAEGEDHRRQKKIMTPAFSPSALRDLTPLFFELSYKMRDMWTGLIESGTNDQRAFKSPAAMEDFKASAEDGVIAIEVMKWMSRLTLDIIGRAGFGYSFDSLDEKENLLGDAFSGLLSSSVSTPSPRGLLIQRTLGSLITRFPFILNYVPNDRIKAVTKAFSTMDSESRKIVDVRRSELEADGEGGGKDLLSLLLKANAAGDAKMQMSDAELQGQMTVGLSPFPRFLQSTDDCQYLQTFILAGHETTSTALTWTLWKLAKYPVVQEKLRREIREARKKAKDEGREELGSDELNSLEYLDAVCREILRTESPVSATIRSSAKDDMIPLSAPITGRSGRKITSIPIKAGDVLFLSINAANFNKAVFGEDADDFRPERWIEGHVGEKQAGVGVYSQLLTFLAGLQVQLARDEGVRARFFSDDTVGEANIHTLASAESRILSVLVDSFEFDEREPGLAIERRSAIVSRSLVVGEEQELKYAMPLRVKLAQRGD